eukprot:scaffold121875_cov44-Prasinocladus_malaysianus.AAC.2
MEKSARLHQASLFSCSRSSRPWAAQAWRMLDVVKRETAAETETGPGRRTVAWEARMSRDRASGGRRGLDLACAATVFSCRAELPAVAAVNCLDSSFMLAMTYQRRGPEPMMHKRKRETWRRPAKKRMNE